MCLCTLNEYLRQLLAPFPRISEPFAPRSEPPSSPFFGFLMLLVSFCFPFMYFLLFLPSPVVFLGFGTLSYIYACTLHLSTVRIQFPLRFRPRSHSETRISFPFILRTSAQPPQPFSPA